MPPANILYAEDEETDVYLFRMALKKCGLEHTLHHVNDGQETMEYLGGLGRYNDRARHPLPDLLLLDLKMPRASGLEVLDWMNANKVLPRVPAVMLTSQDHPTDIENVKRLGASDYLIKPHDMVSLIEIVRKLDSKWLGAKSA